jgi:hypothetical protein
VNTRIIIAICLLFSTGCEPGADATPWSWDPEPDGSRATLPPEDNADAGPGEPTDPLPIPGACVSDSDCIGLDGACSQGICQTDGKTCVSAPLSQVPCDDGDPCTDQDRCDGGACEGSPALCDDGRPCTSDACDAASGGCVFSPTTGPCDDGDPCTGIDTCSGGTCQGIPTQGCHYLNPPQVPACQPGSLAKVRKRQALERVNELRTLSGLPPVVYDEASQAKAQAAALVSVANSDIEHQPPGGWVCWSQLAFDGCDTGNLHIGWQSEAFTPDEPPGIIDGWLIDTGVPSLGHRRWILDPFLAKIAYGSVHGPAMVATDWGWSQAAVLSVIHDEDADISGLELPFIAYPVGDYPSEAFDKDWYHSFSVLSDTEEKWGNEAVDFTDATVQVTGPSGPLVVTDVYPSNAWYGLPNHLQWIAHGLVDGVTYTVTVSDVYVEDVAESYTYNFRLL